MNKTFRFSLALMMMSSLLFGGQSWFDKHIRRIHMDFHTPEIAPDMVIKSFNAQEYVKTLKDAHVNSLVTFAKGHHGNSYYATKIGHKHSGLPDGVDMFGEILDECHNNDIKVLAYYSVGWLTTVEKNHPEWMQRNIDGETTGTDGRHRTNTWNCICLNAPYLDEVVVPELQELVSNYDMDGIWLDIIENSPCYCQWCAEKYQSQFGELLPEDKNGLVNFADQTRRTAVKKMVAAVKAIKPEVLISFNTAGRDPSLVPLVDFCSIETHPGATWHQTAWTHGLLTMKFLQRYNKPWESTTSRFIHGWGGWDDQTTENMMAVASRIAAHGGVINLGDQTYPTGKLDGELYKKIGKVFEKIKTMETWAVGSASVPSIGLFATDFDIYSIYRDPHEIDNYLGATKILLDNHWHFDLVAENDYTDLSAYECLVLPNVGELEPATVQDIRDYVRNGGKILVTGNISHVALTNEYALADVLGVHFRQQSPYSHGYLDMHESVSQNLRRSPLLVPGPFLEVEPATQATVLSKHIYPILEPQPDNLLFFRNPQLSPPGTVSAYPAIVQHAFGEGRAIYCAAPLFKVYMEQQQWYLKDVVQNLLNTLDVDPIVQLDAPQSVEMVLSEKDGSLVVHLINYVLHNETNQVEDVYPARDVELILNTEFEAEPLIRVIGDDSTFSTFVDAGRLGIKLNRVDVYSQIVITSR